MIEEIFGEFRVPLIEAQAAIYSQNHDQLRQILNNIEYKMFEEHV